MEEMRLFEVGFKEGRHKSGYYEKFYVVAEGGEKAIEKARKWLEQEHYRWWKEEGRMMEKWELASPAIEKSGLTIETDEQFENWCTANSLSYNEELTEKLENTLKFIASLQLAKLYDVGNAIV